MADAFCFGQIYNLNLTGIHKSYHSGEHKLYLAAAHPQICGICPVGTVRVPGISRCSIRILGVFTDRFCLEVDYLGTRHRSCKSCNSVLLALVNNAFGIFNLVNIGVFIHSCYFFKTLAVLVLIFCRCF